MLYAKIKPPPERDRSMKRGHTELLFPQLTITSFPKPENYSRFLVIESLNAARLLASQSAFFITKYLDGIIKKSYNTKQQRKGEVFVEVKNQQQATTLVGLAKIVDLDIRVTAHGSQISSHGVISEADLLTETNADILEGLKDQGVTGVRRITRRRDKIIPRNILSDVQPLLASRTYQRRLHSMLDSSLHSEPTPLLQVPAVRAQHNLLPRQNNLCKISSAGPPHRQL